ncbi:peptidoglycan-binding domain-containing protein [Streptomyces sp. NPDC089424]|uniref:peptidoglycan-binding domain-containing protein n=1 Tax=Streptomyces sp. NPDC089424 TaxID=3365917 RepID=UPI0037F999F8
MATASGAEAAPAAQRTADVRAVAPLAVNNLGLTVTQAKKWQCYLRDWHYSPGVIDGQLGTDSWKAAQRAFNAWGYDAGVVDGIVGPDTIKALQRFLSGRPGSSLEITGVAGPETREEFAEFASRQSC